MRKRTLLLSITVAWVAATAALGWVTIGRGFRARDNPSAVDTLIATTTRQLAPSRRYGAFRRSLLRVPRQRWRWRHIIRQRSLSQTTGYAAKRNTKQERWRALLHD